MHVISVDVGTGSVRAALTEFDERNVGHVLSFSCQETQTFNPKPNYYEQKSEQVWTAITSCIKRCLEEAKTDKVHGIAFTATCSLVAVESGLENDIILWMDHRSVEEAEFITNTRLPQLNQSGGICSPEFSVAKLLWMKRNQNKSFLTAKAFLELPDFFTWKCLGIDIDSFSPSICSLTCKWFFDAEAGSWNETFVKAIDLQELFLFKEKSRIGRGSSLPGTRQGFMSSEIKKQLGISQDCNVAVASSIIDAHSGVVGMLSLHGRDPETSVESILCSIAGTSTCHMVCNESRIETQGIWGPYLNVVAKGYYVREPGQSATGKLIDFILDNPCLSVDSIQELDMKSRRRELVDTLNDRLSNRELTFQKLVMNPSFHGNRCPIGDSTLRGGIYGLDLQRPLPEDVYEATIESLCYETRFIIEKLKSNPKVVLVSGGLAKNSLFLRIYSDIIGVPVVAMDAGIIDMMLAGTAILARQAVIGKDNCLESMSEVTFKDLDTLHYKPNHLKMKYHETKYKAYRIFVKAGQEMQKLLNAIH